MGRARNGDSIGQVTTSRFVAGFVTEGGGSSAHEQVTRNVAERLFDTLSSNKNVTSESVEQVVMGALREGSGGRDLSELRVAVAVVFKDGKAFTLRIGNRIHRLKPLDDGSLIQNVVNASAEPIQIRMLKLSDDYELFLSTSGLSDVRLPSQGVPDNVEAIRELAELPDHLWQPHLGHRGEHDLSVLRIRYKRPASPPIHIPPEMLPDPTLHYPFQGLEEYEATQASIPGKGIVNTIFVLWNKFGLSAREGWKIHISARVEDAQAIANLILPELRNRLGVTHKVVRSLDEYLAQVRSNSGQAGKFITIYPKDKDEARTIAKCLDELLKQHPNLRGVPIDEAQLGDTGLLYARYGSYKDDVVHNLADGMTEMDVRGQPPAWHRAHQPFGKLYRSRKPVENGQ